MNSFCQNKGHSEAETQKPNIISSAGAPKSDEMVVWGGGHSNYVYISFRFTLFNHHHHRWSSFLILADFLITLR